MKTKVAIYKVFLFGLFPWALGCDPEVEIPRQEQTDGYTMLYMPQAVDGIKNIVLNVEPEPQDFIIGAAFGGMGYPQEDIEVSIAIDPQWIEAYNIQNDAEFPVMPENAYSLSGTKVVIPKGKLNSSILKLTVNTEAMPPFIEHLLAVRIESANKDVKINEDLRTAIFKIKTDFIDFDRSLWTVVDFSSEEPKEAEWGNGGQVIHIFDGMDNTFWHTKWDGGEAPPPHWFIIDMASVRTMHGLKFLSRQSGHNGKPKGVDVEISIDGSEWETAGSFILKNTNDMQRQFFTEGFGKQARYLKVTVTSPHDAVYTHLAEVYAF